MIKNITGKEFEQILNLDLSKYDKLNLANIEINDSNLNMISNKIKHYLSIRDNENPDYGIEWKGRFNEESMFVEEVVLGNKMRLFQGNEDYIILFLTRLFNSLEKNTALSWFLADNHKEQDDFLTKLKSKRKK